jgi:hypothetical protein
MHTGTERRSCAFQLAGAELRGAGSPALVGWTLAAYASVTDTPYEVTDDLGTFEETVHRGSFADTLARGPDVAFLANHSGLPLGRTASGTLTLNEDTRGLRYTVTLDPENPAAQSLRSAVNRRDATESSFAFKVTDQEWNPSYTKRAIYAVDLHRGDCSVVTYGANEATGAPDNATTLRAAYDRQIRAKYSADQLTALGKKGHAFLNPDGHYSFPIDDLEDLKAALHAVGRAGADHDKIRKYIAGRAKAMGQSALIPANWNSDGSLQGANAAGRLGSSRATPLPKVASPMVLHCNCCPPCAPASCDGSCCDACPIGDVYLPNADVASSSLDDPSNEFLGQLNDLTVRLAILRLKGRTFEPVPLFEERKP